MNWREWPVYSRDCTRDVARLLNAGGSLSAYRANPRHGPGPRRGSWAWKLERQAERVHKVSHVIVCANGTIALEILLKSFAGPNPVKGEVITPALTFSATVGAILAAGLTPVFADVRIPECTLDPVSATRMTNRQTVTQLAVDLFGRQAQSRELSDACQSVGIPPVSYHGVWSFNGRKNVPAGEGGAIFTDSNVVEERCRLLLGHAENFTHWVGTNGHMNELTACVAYHGMLAVQRRNAHRHNMATLLNESLSDSDRVLVPNLSAHALYLYPLVIDEGMEAVANKLQKAGVECQRGYIQPPLHRYEAFQHVRRDTLPQTESLSHDRLLLFPQVTPTATRQEMGRLAEQIKKALR